MNCVKYFPGRLLPGLTICAVLAAGRVTAGEAPNSVVKNGGFETAAATNDRQPAFWFKPDGLGVQWAGDPASPAHGKGIRMDTALSERKMQEQWVKTGLTQTWNIPQPGGNPIAETYGLSYDSDIMPVKPGQAYRLTFDYKGAGGGKVWVRCYGEFNGERRQRYEKLLFCAPTGGRWMTFSSVLNPTARRADATQMKVMLFAAYPAGIYWFDNIRLEPISDQEYQQEKAAGTKKVPAP